jgi:hypothetical protein
MVHQYWYRRADHTWLAGEHISSVLKAKAYAQAA